MAASLGPASAQQPTLVRLGTATPGGGFQFFGNALADLVTKTDPGLLIEPNASKGSTENIALLEADALEIALVAGEPAYEAFAGIGRPKSADLSILAALYANPGMLAVRGDSPVHGMRDLLGKPVAWGTPASGLTLLGRYVVDGLGYDRDKDFQPFYLEHAGDGPLMVADGRVAALWGGGIGWPGFTAITTAGGRLVGLTPEEVARVTAKHNFLKPMTVPAGAYPGQSEPVQAVGSWSYLLARKSLEADVAYRIAKALAQAQPEFAGKFAQARETTPASTVQAALDPALIHPGAARYLRELGLM